MKNEEVATKDTKEQSELPQPKKVGACQPEHGAASQLHNYNVLLSRLGDLFGEDDEPKPRPADMPAKP